MLLTMSNEKQEIAKTPQLAATVGIKDELQRLLEIMDTHGLALAGAKLAGVIDQLNIDIARLSDESAG
jgi:hypothetical protein